MSNIDKKYTIERQKSNNIFIYSNKIFIKIPKTIPRLPNKEQNPTNNILSLLTTHSTINKKNNILYTFDYNPLRID